MINQLIIPEVRLYTTCQKFIVDFLEMNKAKDPKFSHRFFAKKLQWPASLLSQISAGKKRLSLERSLEFAAFAKMSDTETDKLLLLSLRDHQGSLVRRYAERQMNRV